MIPALTLVATSCLAGSADFTHYVDVNGDGLGDRLQLEAGGSLSVYLMGPGRSFQRVDHEVGVRHLVVDLDAADANGDGATDLIVVSPAGMQAFEGDGRGRFSDATSAWGLATAPGASSVRFEDLDRDGRLDIVATSGSGDAVYWSDGLQTRYTRDTGSANPPSTLEAVTASLDTWFAGADDVSAAYAWTVDGQPTVTITGQGTEALFATPTSTTLTPGPSLGPSGGSASGALSGSLVIPTLTADEKEILSLLSLVELDDGQGGTAKTVRLSGANLQIVNGLGATNGDPDSPFSSSNAATNGVGNIIVGYNELRSSEPNDRTGSHNLIIGERHNASSYGGIVVGSVNEISARFAVVTAGTENVASAAHSAISGGIRSIADGPGASISGGDRNSAMASFTTIAGGFFNEALVTNSSILGGQYNSTQGVYSTIVGGEENITSATSGAVVGGVQNDAGKRAVCIGGLRNVAVGEYSAAVAGSDNYSAVRYSILAAGAGNVAGADYSAIVGGSGNETFGITSCIVAGSLNQTLVSGAGAAIVGGRDNVASDDQSTVTGGRNNTADGEYSSISGGSGGLVTGTDDWLAGSLFEDN